MKRLLFVILLVSQSFTLIAQSERVISFHSDIIIDTSSTISVTESIKIYSNGTVFKRGITRTIPTIGIDSTGNRVKHDLKIISVEKDGRPSKYHTEKQSGSITIYVGERDVFLTEGEYEYTINYSMSGQIRFFNEYDELYWNVNGFDWAFPFGEVSSKITLPSGGEIIQSTCYTGAYGSVSQNCSTEELSENSVRISAESLYPGENLTVAVGFEKGIVNQPPPPPPGW